MRENLFNVMIIIIFILIPEFCWEEKLEKSFLNHYINYKMEGKVIRGVDFLTRLKDIM